MAVPPARPHRSKRSALVAAAAVVSCAAVLLTAGAIGHFAWQRYSGDLHEVRQAMRPPDFSRLKLPDLVERGPSRIIYLNREGAVLRGGSDDATQNVSSIVSSAGLRWAEVPAFAGTPARWEQIVRCVRSKFEPYDVSVVDQRPVEGSFVMAVLGGTPALLGDDLPVKTKSVTGLAPFSGEPIRDAVVLAFTREMKEATRTVCETTSMEIAHAYGLDHARSCGDVMTYMKPCGAKSFTDADIACGEEADRPCKGGAPTQNSHAMLLATLGPRPAKTPEAQSNRLPGKGTQKISAAPAHAAEDGHLHTH